VKRRTNRVISEGCTKIEAPRIMPTTIAVAWESPIERRREEVIEWGETAAILSWRQAGFANCVKAASEGAAFHSPLLRPIRRVALLVAHRLPA